MAQLLLYSNCNQIHIKIKATVQYNDYVGSTSADISDFTTMEKYLEEIDEALDFFFKTKMQERTICCKNTAGMQIKIILSELLLIETSGRKLRYLMLDGSEHFCEGRISETAQSLSPFGFFYVQRSYIVNLKYIETVNSHEITLCNGLKITIGRVRSKEFKKAFFKWRMLFGD